MYGPFVMCTRDKSKEFITLHIGGDIKSCFRPLLNREAGAFAIAGLGREFVPLYLIGDEPYHTYFIIE